MIGLYKHFKGKYYLKLFDARNCDDCTEIDTIYMSLYKSNFGFGTIWRRSKRGFEGRVSVNDGKYIKRFKRII